MDDNSFSVPKMGDQLFKEIVGDWHNACLYPLKTDMWVNYIVGYKDAADILVEHVKTSGKSSDRDLLAFPIVFLYRHYLELQLKTRIKDGYQLLPVNRDYAKCHKLDELWNDCKIIINKLWPKGEKEPFDAMDDYINQFCQVDPTSTEFRYPTRRNGSDSLNNLETFNLNHLSVIMKSIDNFLGGIHDTISIELEIIRDHDESPNEW